MSRNASLTLDWADGTFHFRLGWAELEKLQEAVDAGPFVILDRLQAGTNKIGDISHVLRLGLIGGGMPPVDAMRKVRSYVEDRPPAENRLHAIAVMSAGCYGAPEEEIEKKSEAPDQESRSTISPMERSGSEPSTESAES